MNVLRWAENILENVDQQARKVVADGAKPSVAQQQIALSSASIEQQQSQQQSQQHEAERKLLNRTQLERSVKEELSKNLEISSSLEQDKLDDDLEQSVLKTIARAKELAGEDPSLEVLAKENETLRGNTVLLHKEVKELSSITSSLSERYKKAQTQLKKFEIFSMESRERLENQVSRLLQEKMNLDSEFAATLEQREKQQRQLSLRIDDLLKQLKGKDSLIADIQAERDKNLNEHLRQVRAKDEQLDSIMQRVEVLEQQLTDEKEARAKHKSVMDQNEAQQAKEYAALEEELSQTRDQIGKKMEEIVRLESSVKIKESEFKLKDRELQDYKTRAVRVLQEKEKTIATLSSAPKGGQQGDMSSTASEPATVGETIIPADSTSNNDDLLIELENLRNEHQELQASLELAKRQHEAEVNSLRLQLRNVNKTLERERAQAMQLQQTIQTTRLNMDHTKQRLEEEKRELQESIKSKQAQMKQLQQQLQLADKMDVKNELETKCRIMAEHLIEKQALNETLNSEKAALQLQLEKTQQRVKEVELVARITPTAAVVHRRSNQPHEDPLDEEDDSAPVPRVKSQKFFHSLKQRGFVSRKIAGFLHLVDRVSIQLGRYLRLPLLRVMVVLYIFLLHAWVLVVLFSASHAPAIDARDTPSEK